MLLTGTSFLQTLDSPDRFTWWLLAWERKKMFLLCQSNGSASWHQGK